MEELKKTIEELGRAFEEFKKANDQRIAEIQKKGSASPETEAKVDKANAAIEKLSEQKSALEKEIAEMKTVMNRLNQGGTEGNGAKKGDSPEEKAAFLKFLRKGEDRLSDAELKSLSVDSQSDGGFLVRPELADKIVTKMFETTPMRMLADVVSIGSDQLDILQDLDETSAGWVSERGARSTGSTPKLNLGKIAVHELFSEVAATQKLLDDGVFDVESWMAGKTADKLSRVEATAFVSGTGVNQPRGFLSYASGTSYGQIEQKQTAGAGALDFDTIIDLLYSLKPKYAPNAQWLMQRMTVSALRKLKDTQNRYLWEPSLQVGQPDSLLGKPVSFAADMPAVATGALAIAVGDFKQGYQIVDRVGIRILRDPFTSKPNVIFYTTKRVGGDVIDFDAIKLLKVQ